MNAPVRNLAPARSVFDSNSLEVTVASTLNDMMQVIALRAIVYMGEQTSRRSGAASAPRRK